MSAHFPDGRVALGKSPSLRVYLERAEELRGDMSRELSALRSAIGRAPGRNDTLPNLLDQARELLKLPTSLEDPYQVMALLVGPDVEQSVLLMRLVNALLVPWLAHAGLALAIGLGACINAMALLRGLRKRGIYSPSSGWRVFVIKISFSLLLMGGCLFWASHQINWIALQSTPFYRALLLGSVLSAAFAAYLAALWLTGLRLKDFRRAPKTSTNDSNKTE